MRFRVCNSFPVHTQVDGCAAAFLAIRAGAESRRVSS